MNLVSEFLKGRRPKNPLSTISVFLATAALFGYCGMKSVGGIQAVLFASMVLLTLLVFTGFLYVWIRHPENLYSPSEYVKGKIFAEMIKQKDTTLNKDLEDRANKLESLCENLQKALERNTIALETMSGKSAGPSGQDQSTLC